MSRRARRRVRPIARSSPRSSARRAGILRRGPTLGDPAAEGAPGPARPAAPQPRRPTRHRPARSASTAAEPIERQPYRIVFHFACHPSSRIDAARRADLLRDWQVMVRRFVGTPWTVSIAPPSGPVLDLDLEGLEKATPAQAAAFEKAVNAGSYDKVWVVHADRPDSGCRRRLHRPRVRHGDPTARPAPAPDGRGPRRRPARPAGIHARPVQPDGADQRRGRRPGPPHGPRLRHRAGQPDRQGRLRRRRSSSRCGSSPPRTARSSCGSSRGPISASSRSTGPSARCADRLGAERPAEQAIHPAQHARRRRHQAGQ